MNESTIPDLAVEMRTFGPNWRQVVAVIRRAAALTPDEAKRLNAAWDAAMAAAWDATRAAASRTARGAAWAAASRAVLGAAAWAAASDAASRAARDAARDAATAAVVADLVGQHGLTQNHIDTLMKPWTDTLGQDWAEGIKP